LTTFRPKDPITLQLSLIIYNGMSFRFSTVERLPLLILFGILVDDLSALQDRQRVRDELTERQLKAIADQTRLEILRSLSRGEQYVQQLADQLQLTAATLSHHLNQLLAVMLVGLRGEGRRNYYHLNRNELSALAADLNRLAGNYGEK
jgi:DNA-binding transcriptional ArsR family regulator